MSRCLGNSSDSCTGCNNQSYKAIIENCRCQGQWKRILHELVQLVEQPHYYHLLVAEARLESFLATHEPLISQVPLSNALLELNYAEQLLLHLVGSVTIDEQKGEAALHYMDACLLLAKLSWARGANLFSLRHFSNAKLTTLEPCDLPMRSVRLIAEAWTIRAICEQQLLENPTILVKSFNCAMDYTLRFLQEHDQLHSQPAQLGSVLELALQRGCPRRLLLARETRSTRNFRIKAAAKLALELLRGQLTWQPIGHIKQFKLPHAPAWLLPLQPPSVGYEPAHVHEETLLLTGLTLIMEPQRLAFYDFLTLATVRWGRGFMPMLATQLKRALFLSSSTNAISSMQLRTHLWQQYALSLVCAGQHMTALRQLQRLMEEQSTNGLTLILAARLCYTYGTAEFGIVDGLKYALRALRLTEQGQGQGHPRARLFVGIGQLRSGQTALALATLQLAVQNDQQDHLAFYYLALQLALDQQMQPALQQIQQALQLRPEHAPSLELLALVLTAQQRHGEALHVVELALTEYPLDLRLLRIKAQLELERLEPASALHIARIMLRSCQVHEARQEQVESNGRRLDKLEIWLLLVECYLALADPAQARQCLEEAATLAPLNSSTLLMRARWHLHEEQLELARQCLSNALALHPRNPLALYAMGKLLLRLRSPCLAEQLLREALALEEHRPQIWLALGQAKRAQGDHSAAVECLAKSIEFEAQYPVLPFSWLPLVFE